MAKVYFSTKEDFNSLAVTSPIGVALKLGAFDTYTALGNNVYRVLRKTGYITFDGTEVWEKQSTINSNWRFAATEVRIPLLKLGSSSEEIWYTTNFKSISANQGWGGTDGYSMDTGGISYIVNKSCPDVASLRKWLQGKPLHVQYETTNEFIEDISLQHFNQDSRFYNNALTIAKKSSNVLKLSLDALSTHEMSYSNVGVNGGLTITKTSSDMWANLGITVKVKPNTTYTLSFWQSVINLVYIYDSKDESQYWGDANGTYQAQNMAVTFTTKSTTDRIRVQFYSQNSTSVTLRHIMLNEGATPMPYQPYNGDVVYTNDLGLKRIGFASGKTSVSLLGLTQGRYYLLVGGKGKYYVPSDSSADFDVIVIRKDIEYSTVYTEAGSTTATHLENCYIYELQ